MNEPETVTETTEEPSPLQLEGEPQGTTFRTLPVPLTDEEVEELIHDAKEEQDAISKKAIEVAGLKARVKLLNDEIAGHQSRVAELVRICDARAEDRRIECEWRHLYERNTVRLHRLDTLALVEERAMSAEERQRQRELDLGGAASAEAVGEFFGIGQPDGLPTNPICSECGCTPLDCACADFEGASGEVCTYEIAGDPGEHHWLCSSCKAFLAAEPDPDEANDRARDDAGEPVEVSE